MQARSIARLIEPEPVLEGAGVRLKRSIATRTLDYVDPFLLFDHFGSDNPADYLAGFPMHPHRGIETVTYMLAGKVFHRDSLGNSGSIRAGDVQWMTASGGILHEEMPQPVEGQLAGFQLWVNRPARLKMMKPRYQEIASAHIPEVVRADGSRIRVIAGEVDGVRGAVTDIVADPTYLDVSLAPRSLFSQPVERGHAAFVYVFEGEGSLGEQPGQAVRALKMAVLGDGDLVEVRTAERPVRFLLVSGRPLGEPIARYGPFVMNTMDEIEQAQRDLRNGTFVR